MMEVGKDQEPDSDHQDIEYCNQYCPAVFCGKKTGKVLKYALWRRFFLSGRLDRRFLYSRMSGLYRGIVGHGTDPSFVCF